MTVASVRYARPEKIVSVVVILLMFLAVIAMVKKIDEDRQQQAVLAADSREVKDRIRNPR
jgi:hypothetical protein